MTVLAEPAPTSTAAAWSGDVLDVCAVCGWSVRVDELAGGECSWCRGVPLG